MSPILIGGIISLGTAIAIKIVDHFLEMRKFKIQKREYLSQIVYNKQIEFFDKLAILLPKLNIFVSTLKGWIEEGDEELKKTIDEYEGCLEGFSELIDCYYMYLPSSLLDGANKLHGKLIMLRQHPTPTQQFAEDCLEDVMSFQDSIRNFVGIDRLSKDLFKALGKPRMDKKEIAKL